MLRLSHCLVLLSLLSSHSKAARDTVTLIRKSDGLASEVDNRDEKTTLRVSALRHKQPGELQRIIDTQALKDLEGDPGANEYVYHPPGHEANLKDYTFFAHWSKAMCGASVVHDDILLTAGHCGRKAKEPLWRKQVRLMSKYREKGGITRYVAHIEMHPGYNQLLQENDFQIIKVHEGMFRDKEGNPTGVSAVKLNKNKHNPAPGDPIQAVGFGTVTPDGHTGNSQVLMDASLQAFSNDHCAKQYGPGRIVDDIMVCIGSPDGTIDTCHGDSGGPMLDKDGVQVALVSWGEGCADADRPGVGSRVSNITSWVERQICHLSSNPPSSCRKEDTTSMNNELPNGYSTKQSTFDLRVTVQHDNAPEEISWSLTHKDSFSLLYLQPYETVPVPFVDISHEFHHLTAGSYLFEIGDSNEDGICCLYGEGGISISNQHHEVLWEHSGDFENYLGVTLNIDMDGNLVDLQETMDWTSPADRATEYNAQNYVNDPKNNDVDWPGEFPLNENSITVNVKHDSRPLEVVWSIYYLEDAASTAAAQSFKDGEDGLADSLWDFLTGRDTAEAVDEGWHLLLEDNSKDRLSNTLQSKTLGNLEPGLYQFVLEDKAGNGICCDYRFGWATLTTNSGPSKRHQILWEHNGEFDYLAQITFVLSEDGSFKVA